MKDKKPRGKIQCPSYRKGRIIGIRNSKALKMLSPTLASASLHSMATSFSPQYARALRVEENRSLVPLEFSSNTAATKEVTLGV